MATNTDDVLVRLGRWALAKVWLGGVLSGGYVIGRHYHWPQAFLTAAAVAGAVALAAAAAFLPTWTRQRPSGIPVADVGLRVMVWAGLVGSVVALLLAVPAVGMVAAALLLTTAARTFGDPFLPLLRRVSIVQPSHRPSRRPPAPAATGHSPQRPAPASGSGHGGRRSAAAGMGHGGQRPAGAGVSPGGLGPDRRRPGRATA